MVSNEKNTSNSSENNNSESKAATTTETGGGTAGTNPDESSKWGYDLYPERKGAVVKPKWSKVLIGVEGKEGLDKIKCERNVVACVKKSPLVKLMMGALKSSGWYLYVYIFYNV